MTSPKEEIWLVYDGECPICKPAVNAFKIKQAAGELKVVNARGNHPIMAELKAHNLNIDDGMVLKIGDNYYHGAEALNICAMIGSDLDFFNRINIRLFRSRLSSRIAYPLFQVMRNIALCMKGVGKVNNLTR